MGPHAARLLETISAGRITVVSDGGPVQRLQVRGRSGADGAPSLIDGVPRIGEYGFASSPPIGSEVVLVRLWGDRTLSIAIGTNHQPSRPKGQSPGDAQLYAARGQKVWLANDALHVDGGGGAIVVENFASCTIKGDLHVTGDVVAQSTGAAVSLVKHVHGVTGGPKTTIPLP